MSGNQNSPANLIGSLVFLERAEPSAGYSNYYDGEYLITRQSASNLYGQPVGTAGGHHGLSVYGLHQGERQLPLVGAGRYNIVAVERPDWDWIEDRLQEAEKHITAVKTGLTKRQWVEYVYDNALIGILNLRRLRMKMDTQQRSDLSSQPPTDPVRHVTVIVPRGVAVEVVYK